MMKSSSIRIVVLAFAVVALASAALASTAGAAVWKFNGTELSGKETIVGAAYSSSLNIPSAATVECEHFLYSMKISNSAGKGVGEVTEVPLYECKVIPSTCTVAAIEPEKLPWPTKLSTVGTTDYLVIEKVSVGITYGGEECALDGTKVVVAGSAGGKVENTAQQATFDKATFEATGTVLKVGSSPVEWNGVFPTEGFEAHREQALEG